MLVNGAMVGTYKEAFTMLRESLPRLFPAAAATQ